MFWASAFWVFGLDLELTELPTRIDLDLCVGNNASKLVPYNK